MSDFDLIYTHDDELRFKEIIAQINWKRAHTRRTSILGVAEIFRVLKTKKHEFDCYGNSLINFLFGVEVVRMLKTLNKSYTDDPEEVFRNNLKKELSYIFHKRDEIIATLIQTKNNLTNREPKDLRSEVIEDIKSSEELIQRRYSTFITYFQMIMKQNRKIAAIVEVTDELRIIKSRISTVKNGLRDKKKLLSYIDFEEIVSFLSDDIDHAIEILNCQADTLASNILANIAETNELINLFERGTDEEGKVTEDEIGGGGEGIEGGSEGSEGSEGREESEEEETAKDGVSEAGLTDSEYDDAAESDLDYLMGALGKPLILSLTHCALRHPVDPICFVSDFINNYRIKEEQAERKNEELKLLLAERERIQLRKKARQEEEEMRKRMEEGLQPEEEE